MRRLKISTLADLNDPFEFQPFRFPNDVYRQAWERSRHKLWANRGIICFSRMWHNPVIWSHYADSHQGLAIGFDVPAELAVNVTYRRSRAKAPKLLELPTDRAVSWAILAMSTKYKHWEYEEETRVFATCDTQDPKTGLYFKDFDDTLVPREVVVGARSPITSAQISDCLGGNLELSVTKTGLATSAYRIVKEQSGGL